MLEHCFSVFVLDFEQQCSDLSCFWKLDFCSKTFWIIGIKYFLALTFCTVLSSSFRDVFFQNIKKDLCCEGHTKPEHYTCNFLIFLESCENGDLKAMHVCGKGAIGCTGTLWNLTCECDYANYYVQAPDGKSCKPSKWERFCFIKILTEEYMGITYVCVSGGKKC